MGLIEDQIELFATFSEKVQKDLIKRAKATYRSSDMEYIQRIMATDITARIVQDLGYGKAVDALIDDYDKIVAGISKNILAKVPRGTVEMLKTLDTQFWFEHVADVGDEIKRTLIHGSIGGVTKRQLTERLVTATKKLSKAQIGSLVNTSLVTMSRAVFAAGATQLGPDAEFIYDGPQDSKNRDECAQVLADPRNAEGFKMKEIGSLPVGLVSGGGFRCRHIWIQAIEL